MSKLKIPLHVRVQEDQLLELTEFAERERRTRNDLAAMLLEWGIEQLKNAGSTLVLFNPKCG